MSSFTTPSTSTPPVTHGTSTLSTSNGTSLPLDVFYRILSILQHSHKHNSLANLQQCSRNHYEIVTPYLYQNLVLSPSGIYRLFSHINHFDKDLIHLFFAPMKISRESTIYDQPAPIRLRYNLTLTKRVYYIHAADTYEYSCKFSISPWIKLMEVSKIFTGDILLPNVKAVIIRAIDRNLGRHTYLGRDMNNVIKLLSAACRPRNICIRRLAGGENDGHIVLNSWHPYRYGENKYAEWLTNFQGEFDTLVLHDLTHHLPHYLTIPPSTFPFKSVIGPIFSDIRISYVDDQYLRNCRSDGRNEVIGNQRDFYMKFQVQELLDCALRYYKPLNLNSVKNNKPWTIVNRSASQKHQNRDDTIRLIEEFKNSIEKAHPALEHFGNYELDKRISMLNQWCQGLTMMDSEQAKPCEACGLPV